MHDPNSRWMQPCEDCPDSLYDLEKLKRTWLRNCKEKGTSYEYKAKQYFKLKFPQYRRELTFVVAYDSEDALCLFVDHKVYQTFKEKLEKEIKDTLPDVLPSRLSKKCVPRTMQRFPSIREFVLFNEVRRQKNRDILRQKHANRLHQLERLEEALTYGKPTFLAFDLRVDAQDTTKLQELGYVSFEFRFEDAQDVAEDCRHFIIKTNKEVRQKDELKHKNVKFCFGDSYTIEMDAALELFRQQASADFLITSQPENAGNLLKHVGLNSRSRDLVDIPSLFHTVFPEYEGSDHSLTEILGKLGIDVDTNSLNNAGNDAAYMMRAFCSLMKGELQCAIIRE